MPELRRRLWLAYRALKGERLQAPPRVYFSPVSTTFIGSTGKVTVFDHTGAP